MVEEVIVTEQQKAALTKAQAAFEDCFNQALADGIDTHGFIVCAVAWIIDNKKLSAEQVADYVSDAMVVSNHLGIY